MASNTHAKLYHDTAGMPPRCHQTETPYPEGDRIQLSNYLQDTQHFGEYLRVGRFLHDPPLSAAGVSRLAKSEMNIAPQLISKYEVGTHNDGTIFPSTEKADLLLRIIFAPDESAIIRGHKMLLKNRLSVINKAYEDGTLKKAANFEQGMPEGYYREKLERCYEEHGFERSADQPEWSKNLSFPSIDYQPDYMLAVRAALGLSKKETGYSDSAVETAESFERGRNRADFCQKLLIKYEEIALNRKENGLVRRDVFDLLNSVPPRSHAQQAQDSQTGTSKCKD